MTSSVDHWKQLGVTVITTEMTPQQIESIVTTWIQSIDSETLFIQEQQNDHG